MRGLRRPAASRGASDHRQQPPRPIGLWAHAISGDLPIVLLQVTDSARIDIVRQLVHAHAYCRLKGLAFDLVIWNDDAAATARTCSMKIHGVIAASADAGLIDRPAGIYVRALDQINHEDRVLDAIGRTRRRSPTKPVR